jgi:gamma-glutamyltranspeptidase/glutathione hydrolase
MHIGDFQQYPYPSKRMATFAPNGMVATSQPLAAQVGLSILKQGGNAIDAAVATAAAMTLLEPTSNGLGSDLFALVWDGNQLHGLNGSGRASMNLSPAVIQERGFDAIPTYGWLPITVPGAPRAWHDLHQRWGALPFSALFEETIGYAETGFPLQPKTARMWTNAARRYSKMTEPEFSGWNSTFLPDGFSPEAGAIFASPGHASSLRSIAETGAESYYRGELTEKILAFSQATGGVFDAADFANHTSTWVDPITTNYRGYDVWEIPPNGQGIVALMALNILEEIDMGQWPRDSAESLHVQIEAIKLAFADAQRYVGDPQGDQPEIYRQLLGRAYATARRALISDAATVPVFGEPQQGDTIYLSTADRDGMMVSLIQSNYMGFGSGVVVPGTGISFQNRGHGFVLESGHPNELAPGKRPFHTIIPGFLTRDGEAIGPFGMLGGHQQPQGHVQLIVNMVDYGMNLQASIDAPRWHWSAGLGIDVEQAMPQHIVRGLIDRGHQLTMSDEGPFGTAEIIQRLPNGSYVAGVESRVDAAAYGY